MFDKSASARHKNEVRVIVTLSGQEPFEAFVFLKIDERLIDLLNDQRQFIPIKRADGTTLIAQKRNIVLVVEVEDEETRAAGADAAAAGEPAPEGAREPAEDHSMAKDGEEGESPKEPQQRARRGIDPYEILRIPPTATIEEIKRAYHARIKAVHPDTIARLELDEDIERAANVTAQRVNRAYRTLLRERKRNAAQSEPAG